jgi:hypothetical protein
MGRGGSLRGSERRTGPNSLHPLPWRGAIAPAASGSWAARSSRASAKTRFRTLHGRPLLPGTATPDVHAASRVDWGLGGGGIVYPSGGPSQRAAGLQLHPVPNLRTDTPQRNVKPIDDHRFHQWERMPLPGRTRDPLRPLAPALS